MSPHRVLIPHSRPTIEADDIDAAGRTLASGRLAQGREVQAFEDEVAAFLGLSGGVATSSGTAALHLALLSLGVGPDAEVLIPSYTCVALLHAVHLSGARARIVDCEPGGVNMSPADAALRRSPATKAIIVPHMFGIPAAIDAFRDLGVPVVENCAQALGAAVDGRPVGSFGDVTVVSFYATKMITTGEGGMLLSRSGDVLAEARDLRDYDNRDDYRLRFNYKMTDVQAALGRTQLRKLPRFVDRRREIAQRYHEGLRDVAPSHTPPARGGACYRYVIEVPAVDHFVQTMAARGIESKRPVYRPLHEYEGEAPCLNAAHTFRYAVSLPIYPTLAERDVTTVAAVAAQAAMRQRDARMSDSLLS